MQKNPRLSAIIEHLLRQSTRVTSVNIAVGELVVLEDGEIHAQWSELVSNTPLAETRLTMRRVPAEQQCMACFEKYQPHNKETSCPHCGSVGAKILAGEEFYLESVEQENK